eukprot:1790102-Rhodomonas_salina.6
MSAWDVLRRTGNLCLRTMRCPVLTSHTVLPESTHSYRPSTPGSLAPVHSAMSGTDISHAAIRSVFRFGPRISLDNRSALLCSFARAMQSPVLTWRMVLPAG